MNKLRRNTDTITEKYIIENNKILNSFEVDTLNENSKVNTLNLDCENNKESITQSNTLQFIQVNKEEGMEMKKVNDPNNSNSVQIYHKPKNSHLKICLIISGFILIIIFIMTIIIFDCF